MGSRKQSFLILLFLITGTIGCEKNPQDIVSSTIDSSIERAIIVKDDHALVLAQWNIGHFSFGNYPESGITATKYYEQYKLYRKILHDINADILAICEYSKVFGSDSDREKYARDILFSDYSYYFEGDLNYYACNALFSNRVLENIESLDFTCIDTDYYYLSADFVFEDTMIKLIGTHLAFNNSNDDYPIAQIRELIDKYENYEYVIIMGDFNIRDINTFNLFVNGGYSLANHGDFGDFETFSRKKGPNAKNYALDNIVVKGLVISDVRVINQDLSDHYPLIATVRLDNSDSDTSN